MLYVSSQLLCAFSEFTLCYLSFQLILTENQTFLYFAHHLRTKLGHQWDHNVCTFNVSLVIRVLSLEALSLLL